MKDKKREENVVDRWSIGVNGSLILKKNGRQPLPLCPPYRSGDGEIPAKAEHGLTTELDRSPAPGGVGGVGGTSGTVGMGQGGLSPGTGKTAARDKVEKIHAAVRIRPPRDRYNFSLLIIGRLIP